ncbi:MAG: anion permease [Acidobacteria bacterium]|nr:anion permease [Acidobacteriota bacterium]
MWIASLLAAIMLAYANGANDNFKGVATLLGSRTTNYRRALFWACSTTLAGSIAAAWVAQELVDTFSGRGLVPDAIASAPAFSASVGLAAAATVLLATYLGLPISTTHALTGALVGAGLIHAANEVAFSHLGTVFLAPLLVSPLLAMMCAAGLYLIFRTCRLALDINKESCLFWGIPVAKVLDQLHYLSAGAVGFARGLNDTPKIAALLVASGTLIPEARYGVVALFIALGGWLSARRVAETLSHKVTTMNSGQGFSANLVTAFLVIIASRLGMPVSTTHVSVGALFGIGLLSGHANKRVIVSIVSSWVGTLPLAAVLAAILCWALMA